MDQYISNSKYWTARIKGKKEKYDALELYDQYIDGIIDLKEPVYNEVLKQVIGVELDCEKRSVKKLQKYDLGIDLDYYIKTANLYCWIYPYNMKTRNWINMARLVRKNKKILDFLPTTFLKTAEEYITLPSELENELNKGMNIVEKN
jgi:hypothetical protein